MKPSRDQKKIDKRNLDEELAWQPVIFGEIADEYAMAVSERDQLKDAADVVRARAELKIRQSMEEAGEKVTEALVKTRVDGDARYRAARDAYLQAKSVAELLLSKKEAFAQRAFVLKDLCGLYVAGYFTTTAVKGKNAQDVGDQAYEERRKRMAKQRRRFDD